MTCWQRYPKYKPSGVEWLGEVPEGWKCLPLKRMAYIIDADRGLEYPTHEDFVDSGIPFFSTKNIKNNQIFYKDVQFITLEKLNQLREGKLKNEDIIISVRGSIGICAIFYSNRYSTAFINAQLMIIRSKRNVSKSNFILYFLISNTIVDYFNRTAYGAAQKQLSNEIVSNIPFFLPPLPEQHAIAAFLYREIARIDALIAKKERQIELLQEKRAALISHAVTKGLDPNAKMKDSGVEWLGEVPEGWEVKKLKNFCDIVGRIGFRGYTTEDQVPEGEGALALGATQINERGEVNRVNSVFVSWEKYYESPEIFVNVNDLLIVQRGSTCGKVGLVSEDYGPTTINPSVVLVKRIKIPSKYLFFWLSSQIIQGFLASLKTSTAIPMLSQNQIENCLFVCPSESEMELIINHVINKIQEIDLLKNRIDKSLMLLREYRSALISAAVTGKIDVRQEVSA